MNNKEIINLKLKELSASMKMDKSCGITAMEIASLVGIQRNVASHFLNELVREGNAIKINTRPVYFMHSEVYERRKNETEFITKKMDKVDSNDIKEYDTDEIFKNLVGYNGSLKDIVNQCKSAVLYPPNGLPILLVGSSGVGKSYLAQIIFEYVKQSANIEEKAPYVVFNCAEYANNPQLLSAALFGTTKGAYTGADKDKKGLIEEANGGVLFLDEIHRLSPEGQEKLFLFMDKGVFRRLGESGKWRESKVRMIFATTENPQDILLQTFLRRIPLVVNIPNFFERPLKEKLELIFKLYRNETINMKKDILVSKQVLNIFLKTKAKGNVGAITNAIKISCANGLNRNKKLSINNIKISDLPKEFSSEFVDGDNGNGALKDMLVSFNSEDVYDLYNAENKKIIELNNKFSVKINELKDKKISNKDFFANCSILFNELLDEIIFNTVDAKTNSFIYNSTQKNLEILFANLKLDFGINYYGNTVQIVSYIVMYFTEYYNEKGARKVEAIIDDLAKLYSKEHKVVLKIIDVLETNLNISISRNAIIYLLIYIKSLNKERNLEQINSIIIAHGYNTASSIAGVANRMLGQYVFEAFDMPLDISTAEIARKLNDYILSINDERGLIVLVDMGSLENIHEEICKFFWGDVVIINNISTQMALDVGSRILSNEAIYDIAAKTVEDNKCHFKYIQSAKKKEDAIITTCYTGIGTAQKIKDLLERCFVNKEVKVIAYDYEKLRGNGKDDGVFKQYNVKVIIGTSNPNISEVAYISLEDMIMRRGDNILKNSLKNVVSQEVINKINDEIVKLFTLENVLNYLTILNPDKIIAQVEQAICNIEMYLGFKFENDLKIGLYIHICCMIERLVIKDPIMTYSKCAELEQCHGHFIKMVRNSFSVIENFYRVEIPISEIGFIYDSIKNKVKDFNF